MTPDALQIVLNAAGAAAASGVLAAIILRLARRAPLIVHVVVIVVAAVLAVAGGIALTANAMYISEADTVVALTVTAISGVVAVIVAVLLARTLSQDARTLARDARDLGHGLSVTRTPVCTTELDGVQRELVGSSERLLAARDAADAAEQARRELVTRIAHDLLTPAASIRAIAEVLEDGMSSEPERHARQLGAHVSRLHALVGDLFELSRIDAGGVPLAREPITVADLVSDLVAEQTALAARHDVELVLTRADSAVADLDARQFSRALVNVLVNAIEHSPAGGRVDVAVIDAPDAVSVTVRDHGPGIAPEDLPHLFEPGWRASAARTAPRVEGAGGAGLGLAITRAVMLAHGGTVTAQSASPGAVLELRLPRASAGAGLR
jgi:signal transduction histidine kinase